MTGNDIVAAVRKRIADEDAINCDDTFMLQNVNAAIEYLSKLLIHRKAGCMIDRKSVIDYTHCPAGFHSFVGQPPLFLEGDIIRSYNGRNPVEMRYFRQRERIKALTDVVPFDEEYKEELITYATMICLNKDEFDTAFEQTIMSNLTQCSPGESTATATTSEASS